MDELEQLKQQRLQELQKNMQEKAAQREQQKVQELQKQALLRKLLEPKAKERLARIELANPEFAEKIITLIIYLYQTGEIQQQITENQLIQLLNKIKAQKRQTKITRK